MAQTKDELLGTDLKLRIETRPDFMGIGMDLQVRRSGDLMMSHGRQNLGQAILHRLLTRKGELADTGHPDYGSRLHELIGEPNNSRTRDLVRLYAKECISQDPRVREIVKLTAATAPDNPHVVLLDITVVPIKSSVPMNITFPFYLEVA
ncbi:MAG: GPW/gp25 family protein [Methanoregula sp.]|nr:GPW/gp25 family protein [Methanoregula sp.]